MCVDYLLKKYYNSEQLFQAIYQIKLENKLSHCIETYAEKHIRKNKVTHYKKNDAKEVK